MEPPVIETLLEACVAIDPSPRVVRDAAASTSSTNDLPNEEKSARAAVPEPEK
jgi:hypothetical protein